MSFKCQHMLRSLLYLYHTSHCILSMNQISRRNWRRRRCHLPGHSDWLCIRTARLDWSPGRGAGKHGQHFHESKFKPSICNLKDQKVFHLLPLLALHANWILVVGPHWMDNWQELQITWTTIFFELIKLFQQWFHVYFMSIHFHYWKQWTTCWLF